MDLPRFRAMLPWNMAADPQEACRVTPSPPPLTTSGLTTGASSRSRTGIATTNGWAPGAQPFRRFARPTVIIFFTTNLTNLTNR